MSDLNYAPKSDQPSHVSSLLHVFSDADIRQLEVEAIVARLEDADLPVEIRNDIHYHYLRFKQYNRIYRQGLQAEPTGWKTLVTIGRHLKNWLTGPDRAGFFVAGCLVCGEVGVNL